MRKKFLLLLALAIGLMMAVAGASAERYVTNGSYAAYLGENDYLYVVDPTGTTKVLRSACTDLLSMTESQLYLQAADGRLLCVDLIASSTTVTSAAPTQAELDAVTAQVPYTLENGTLSILDANGQSIVVGTGVTLVAHNGTTLYYMDNGGATLKSVPLTITSSTLVAATQIGVGSAGALSMTVSADGIVIVAADHSLIVIDLMTFEYRYHAAPNPDVVQAILIGNELYYYTQDATTGAYHTSGKMESGVAPAALSLTATATPTATRQATATATATPRATARVTATPRPTSTSDSKYATIRYGNTGSRVRKMQQRLFDLGYPVGTVDGSFGDNTLLGLHLFQNAIGYKERNYASSAVLEKLYAKNAPVYDPYMGLKLNDSGTSVLVMQTMLYTLGYDPGELDGVYGKKTQAAVEVFQFTVGLPVTGEADKTTLIYLYDIAAPTNPAIMTPFPVIPTPTPADTPTASPTPSATPSETPSGSPTATPSETPSATPSESPSATPSETPSATPSETPSESPSATPTNTNIASRSNIPTVE